ncbi:hypothetical protein BV898_01628 [Hypsibius exemplaris]|uniref:Protein aurora borealis n=1 Tax=Hypsibius exemplaris TaxID=2072580 RepID=A0A1W0XAY9_HYPEX|nr:hypothetical protein BV898_01628 [Hypsibius exemplaris]
MFSTPKSKVWIRSDEDASTTTTTAALAQRGAVQFVHDDNNSDAGSGLPKSAARNPALRQHLRTFNSLVKRDSCTFVRKDKEIAASSPTQLVQKNVTRAEDATKSPFRPLSIGKSPSGSKGLPLQRNATLAAFRPSTPKRVKLRKYRTEPFIIALRDEIKKTTGIHPKTPEKEDNPFELHDLPGAMSRSWLSPTDFNSQLETSPDFKWSIDHMATLHPVDIDHHDIIRTEYLKHVQTESDEDDAQENIMRFFGAKDVHLPSPISRQNTPKNWSPSSPTRLTGVDQRKQRDYPKTRGTGVEMKDASCQTDVQIPPGFDFEKYFADFKLGQQLRRSSSSGSVRRRLFAGMETSSTNLSCMDAAANVSTGFVFGSQSNQPFSSTTNGDDSQLNGFDLS